LYMQLKATYEDYLENDTEANVFGAITTADTWIFVIYDREHFYETDKCTVGSSPKFTNLHTLIGWLVSMLDYISE
jgi:hypothetical protein